MRPRLCPSVEGMCGDPWVYASYGLSAFQLECFGPQLRLAPSCALLWHWPQREYPPGAPACRDQDGPVLDQCGHDGSQYCFVHFRFAFLGENHGSQYRVGRLGAGSYRATNGSNRISSRTSITHGCACVCETCTTNTIRYRSVMPPPGIARLAAFPIPIMIMRRGTGSVRCIAPRWLVATHSGRACNRQNGIRATSGIAATDIRMWM